MPRNNRPRVTLLVALIAAAARVASADEAPPNPEQARFFESKVRPVLVAHCLKCHGPDKQKSGLRLDSRAAALAGGELGPAVVPGKPDESLLVSAVNHGDELKMPPSKKLPTDQVADLTRWVAMGAPWPGSGNAAPAAAATSAIRKAGYQITDKDRAHWAFQPVKRPAVPTPRDPSAVKNPVDAFIHAGLEARGLHPNPPASKIELVRRAYYDLTGLPPTPAEVDAFVNDPAPDAYEALVDRLLDSPRYGEKWGRHWLDLVRFAETNSFERDNPKPSAWRYRDYVIRSLNRDKPYDRFVREQLAGDEIAPGDPEALTATGYYRLGIWDDEPADRDQARYDAFDDIIATTSQVFLGLTVDCARCHDHKIDPIPQKDYYKLVSFFRNVNHFRNGGPTDEAPLFESPGARDDYEARLRELNEQRNEVQSRITAIENEFLASREASGAGRVGRRDLDDLRYRFYRDTFDALPDFDAIKVEGSGELPDGRFSLAPRTRDNAFGFVFEGVLIVPEAGKYTFFLDSDDGSRLTVAGQTVITYDGIHTQGKEQSATVDLPKGRLPVRLDYFQKLDGLGLSVAWSGPGFLRRSLSASQKGTTEETDTPGQIVQLIRLHGARVLGDGRLQHYLDLRKQLKALQREKPALETALCVTEAGPVAPETFVLLRGNPHAPGDKLEPGFLAVLGSQTPAIPTPPPGAKTTGRRAALADWITSPSNPLPARVAANRVWQYHFGRGIVRSTSNFGTQGDRPTHPELLDWLASELVAGGWRLKPLHRVIMTSNAYRMSSRPNPEALAKDPANDAFWRFDMRRLSAEEIRDSVLAASGTLSPKMYGPGVYPEIPAEVMAGQSQPGKGWGKSPPEEANRRSIYVHVKRSLIMPIFESFDLGETDRSSPVRFSTTQPTQDGRPPVPRRGDRRRGDEGVQPRGVEPERIYIPRLIP
ncbi:MAG: DUF1549 domain-containing protein [Planctomycetia bacterium]|nr:DUF1549 domain-containing protein [Planctomycetia bacterium]